MLADVRKQHCEFCFIEILLDCINFINSFLDGGSLSSLPHSALIGPASSPVVASGEQVSVPDNLLKICKAKPVIFKGNKILTIFSLSAFKGNLICSVINIAFLLRNIN